MKTGKALIRHPLKPVIDRHSKVLVLGSILGPVALKKKEYYGYPGNHFWRIMEAWCGTPLEDYREKIAAMRKNGIALWDVVGACERDGASDSSIRRIRPNDIPGLLRRYPNIRRVLLNGKTAESIFLGHFGGCVSVPIRYVPSTSPAYASMPFRIKLKAWRKALSVLKKM